MENNVSSRPGERSTAALSSLCISGPQKQHHDTYPAPCHTKSFMSPADQSPFHTPATILIGRLISTKLDVDFIYLFVY